MSRDDMHVVMYKILAYTYRCMKRGEAFDESKITPGGELVGPLPDEYWYQIVEQLVDAGYLKGVVCYRPDCVPTVLFRDPSVTLDGVQFLQENSMMRKALDFLEKTKSAAPFL